MMKNKKLMLILSTFFVLISTELKALGMLDGEATVLWWANDFNSESLESEIGAGAIGGRGELWLNQKWGLSTQLYRSDLEDAELDDAEYFNIDFKRRVFSITDNSYISLGLGWQDIELNNSSSSGARVLIEGRVGLGGVVYLYGQTAWLPELDDFGNRSDVDGTEFEAGLSFEPLPFLSVRAGYRRIKFDYTNDLTSSDESAESKGFVIGAGFHW